MYHYRKIDELINSGYSFFRQISGSRVIYENKFTGMRLLYDFNFGSYKILE